MRFYLDASRALDERPTGIEVYSQKILDRLVHLPQAEDHEWILLAPNQPNNPELIRGTRDNVRWEIIPGQFGWTLIGLSRYFSRPGHKDGVLFVPGHVLPLVTPHTSILTIHDFAFRKFPQAYGWLKAKYLDAELARSARKAQAIIVPSTSTRDDLHQYYGISQDRIHVIHHGHGQLERREVSASLREPIILCVGRVEERKNALRLIEAFRDFAGSHPDHRLVFAGYPGFGYQQIQAIIASLPVSISQRIELRNHVTPSELQNLYQTAQIFAFPSLYEGFGIPLVEAMMADLPILTANNSSLPEIAGKAALYVDPLNVREITSGLVQLADEPILREQLVEAGREQLKKFSWQEAAQKTLTVLLG